MEEDYTRVEIERKGLYEQIGLKFDWIFSNEATLIGALRYLSIHEKVLHNKG